jgi:hypothetical protein
MPGSKGTGTRFKGSGGGRGGVTGAKKSTSKKSSAKKSSAKKAAKKKAAKKSG